MSKRASFAEDDTLGNAVAILLPKTRSVEAVRLEEARPAPPVTASSEPVAPPVPPEPPSVPLISPPPAPASEGEPSPAAPRVAASRAPRRLAPSPRKTARIFRGFYLDGPQVKWLYSEQQRRRLEGLASDDCDLSAIVREALYEFTKRR